MRYLLVGLAARLGWRPCSCYEAVAAAADAHDQTLRDLLAERAENERLRERIAALESAPVPAPRQEVKA